MANLDTHAAFKKLTQQGFTEQQAETMIQTFNQANGVATKDDIKNMATKDDIKDMATKDDIKNIKDYIENIKDRMATKEYVAKWMINTLLIILGLLIAQTALVVTLLQ